jgi:hypothetical protein
MRLMTALLLLGMVAEGHAADRRNACEPDLIAEIPLVISPGGDVFFPATLGDKQVYFSLLIGSGLPLIAESAVESLGLPRRVITGSGQMKSGGQRATHYLQLDDLKIGDYRLLGRAAPIMPQPGVTTPRLIEGKPVVGLLGSTFLRRVDAEIFLAEKKMRLFKPFKCQSRSPAYWGGEVTSIPMRYDAAGAIVFNLELNGKKVESSLLSGEGASTIDANVTRKYFGFDENSPGVKTAPSAGGAAQRFHPMSLTGKGLSISDAPIAFQLGYTCKLTGSRPVYGGIGYDNCVNVVPFNLGVDLLSQMRVYISSERSTIYISTVAAGTLPAAGTIDITGTQ